MKSLDRKAYCDAQLFILQTFKVVTIERTYFLVTTPSSKKKVDKKNMYGYVVQYLQLGISK